LHGVECNRRELMLTPPLGQVKEKSDIPYDSKYGSNLARHTRYSEISNENV
jgi:hypothetical protein